jgi:hypothetical protein
MRRFLFLILFLAAAFSMPLAARKWAYGARIVKLQIDMPSRLEWETAIPSLASEILNQPFSFLGQGTQSIAFESQDGKYVIKFFRFDRLQSKEKAALLFDITKMAFDSLPHETGLIYVHLNETDGVLAPLKCKDRLFRTVTFPLDRMRFVIQRKATLFRTAMLEAKGDPVILKQRIDQFVSLVKRRASLDIKNIDPNVKRNFGFLDESAVEFDFGHFRLEANLDRNSEVHRYTDKLRKWLMINAPESVDYLDRLLADELDGKSATLTQL